MKEMKREKVDLVEKKRKNVASKKSSIGVIFAVLGIIAATVARGIQLDKKEAEEASKQDNE